MGNTFIFDKLQWLADKKTISFHVPGHKDGKALEAYNSDFFSSKMISLDLTELPDTDNLHAPKDIIKEAQNKASKIFAADHTFFLVNGTTSGNIAALMSSLNPGDKVIIPRDCHKSIMYGLVLGGYIPVYIHPEINVEWGIPGGTKPEDIEKAILENPDTKAVVMTYPNYYGICSDIEGIAGVVKKYNKILIVDEAHGSHFILSEALPKNSIQAGADIVIQSTHKTLSAFTQASMLHVKSDKVDIQRLKSMLMMNQSSSPSYLLMASLDMATEIVAAHGHSLMNMLLKQITSFESEIKKIPGVKILDQRVIGDKGIKDKDQTRLVINMTELGLSGIQLSNILKDDYNIQMEMADINNIVGIPSIGSNTTDIEMLLIAIREIASKREVTLDKYVVPTFSYGIPKMIMNPREACFSEKESVDLNKSIGKISGEYIIPYPPGIPILCPGEIITDEVVEYVSMLKKLGGEIVGIEDETLLNIKIIKKI